MKALRRIMRERQQDAAERAETEATTLHAYRAELGMAGAAIVLRAGPRRLVELDLVPAASSH